MKSAVIVSMIFASVLLGFYAIESVAGHPVRWWAILPSVICVLSGYVYLWSKGGSDG